MSNPPFPLVADDVFQRLVDLADEALGRGTVFRFPAAWPYEPMVDLMLFCNPDAAQPHGLMVTSGQKAGLILVLLPRESEHAQWRGTRTAWIVAEWARWVYPECAVEDVQVVRHYASPTAPPLTSPRTPRPTPSPPGPSTAA